LGHERWDPRLVAPLFRQDEENAGYGSGRRHSSTLHYLQAVAATGTTEPAAVMKMMKATPINDFFAHDGHIREDGRMVHDMYLFEVKKPSESREAWDYYKLVATIPADEAFQPLSLSTCPLVEK
jgi:branched-chain amino acid transport system substrate-binding protein